jgi:glycosyltransferase involved in cell wall biosynthesis
MSGYDAMTGADGACAANGRAVVVLGMHRSGTSALAHGLEALGVDLGGQLLDGHDDNPDGYFEDRQVVATSERLLQALGIGWDSAALPAQDCWQQPLVRRLQAEIAADLRGRFGASPLWGFKDPRVIRTLPFWLQVLDDLAVEVHFVLSLRNPLSVAHSLARRNDIALEKGLLLWLVHWLPYLELLRGRTLVVVDYDRLLAEPMTQWARLAQRLNLSAPNLPTFLNERQRHWHFDTAALQQTPQAPALAQRGYALLLAAAEDRTALDDGFWDAWRQLADELQDLAPAWRYLDQSERSGAQTLRWLHQQQAITVDLERQIAALDQRLATTAAALAAVEAGAADLRAELDMVYASRSWRLTGPLRAASATVQTVRRGMPLGRSRGVPPASPARTLAVAPAGGSDDWPQRIASGEHTGVLVVTDWLPQPQRNSSGLRLFTLLKLLRAAGRDVCLLLRNDHANHLRWAGEESELRRVEASLNELGIPVVWGEDTTPQLRRRGPHASLVILSFPEPAHALLPLVRGYAPWATVVYDMMDFHATRFDREARIKNDPELAVRAAEYRAMELALIDACDLTLAISDDERQEVLTHLPQARIEVLPNIHSCVTAPAPLAGREGLFFIGHFLHSPNEDAVFYFVDRILPRVLEKCPQAVLRIAGSAMSERLRALQHPKVELLGYVPHVEPVFDRSRVFVAPLRFGAGMKGKVGQSLSLGLPVVTTSIGAEGMGLVNDQHALIADDPQAFADAVIRLYQDDALWSRLSVGGLELMQERYSEQAAARTLQRLLAHIEA